MSGYREAMLARCTEPGCTTLVFGVGACLAHQTASTQEFARGRPFVATGMAAEPATAAAAASRAMPEPPPFEHER